MSLDFVLIDPKTNEPVEHSGKRMGEEYELKAESVSFDRDYADLIGHIIGEDGFMELLGVSGEDSAEVLEQLVSFLDDIESDLKEVVEEMLALASEFAEGVWRLA